MSPKTVIFCAIFVASIFGVFSQSPVNILLVLEQSDESLLRLLNDVVSYAQKNYGGDHLSVNVEPAFVDRQNIEESYKAICAVVYRGVNLILDLTWTGWIKLGKLATSSGIVYIRGEPVIYSYVQAVDDMLKIKNATDCALIFEQELELNQSLYYLIGSSIIRLVVIDDFTSSTVGSVGAMRPLPSYFVIYSSTTKMEDLFRTAIDGNLVTRNSIWNLVFTDFNYQDFSFISENKNLNVSVTIVSMDTKVCCNMLGRKSCDCPDDFKLFDEYFRNMIYLLVSTMSDMEMGDGVPPIVSVTCEADNTTERNVSMNNINSTHSFKEILKEKISTNSTFVYIEKNNILTYRADIIIDTLENEKLDKIAHWNTDNKLVTDQGKKIEAARRYFRIGTTEAIPWSTIKRDVTGKVMRDSEGNEIWEGYCIDLIEMLAKLMDFDYDLVIPKVGTFGAKGRNNQWDGLVGDLAKGETDIAVAALTMTSDREEVIDYVAPYFEQTGILITIRKPMRKTSLFKFMTVLREEVWLSIVGALTLTGFMIWLLDKYSPYSARNNKELYPYPCREFTLKESFWFALTSFTPQGGGEAPKALSSRTLVAAYWLFVVLMLATFTANLAAFLTVERMQSPVQSLEELGRQSRINYTVVTNSTTHQYFMNMQKAEDKIYEMWKQLTLNSTTNQIEYRVWDYPIREQYGHILQAIEQAGPVATAEEGFRKVENSENAEFAFIHDSAEIKYEISRNCNLTEIGEVFAEQPYAVAVQQGSHLQEEISRTILDLQKDRYFEHLATKYWNSSRRAMCQNSDESEGITLESLGGVFIATLIGLALAMVTLAGEVIYYRKKNANQEKSPKTQEKIPDIKMEDERMKIQKLASKLKLRPAPLVAFDEKPMKRKPRISHISVSPQLFPYQE